MWNNIVVGSTKKWGHITQPSFQDFIALLQVLWPRVQMQAIKALTNQAKVSQFGTRQTGVRRSCGTCDRELLLLENINVLTERQVCTEKYWTEVFFVQTEPVVRAMFVQKHRGPIFLRASEVNKKFIVWHLYLKRHEMHDLKWILVAWYTFGRRKQKIPMYSFFST
jgi:hypothetical protein